MNDSPIHGKYSILDYAEPLRKGNEKALVEKIDIDTTGNNEIDTITQLLIMKGWTY